VGTAFDELVARANPAMVIVTTVAGGERSGCLVGFHCQCSIDPPRYAVWISRANHTFGVAAHAHTFAVHFVPTSRHDLADLFGGETGDHVDKLARCDWTEGPGGVPLLDGCPDRFVGHLVEWLEEGDADHACVVLEPADALRSGSEGWLHLANVTDIEPGHGAEEG
jgi:flavin reductase (DIM6/NTAB) family NADH-FMN oxidoreductase RutF